MDINTIGKNKVKPGLPKLSPGDNVRVSFKIKEASRERGCRLSRDLLLKSPGIIREAISQYAE